MITPVDPYRARLVEAYTDLMREEARTDLTYEEIRQRMATVGELPPYPSVRRWLREFVRPDDDNHRTALAVALGVERDWLFAGRGQKRAQTRADARVSEATQLVTGDPDLLDAERPVEIVPGKKKPGQGVRAWLAEKDKEKAAKKGGRNGGKKAS